MSRKPRKLVDSGFYHIILRGNNQQNIFNNDTDKDFFINRINKYAKESGIEIFAYCLMDNHVHFLIGNGNNHMALFVKKIACSYVYYFNHKYGQTGHLFQGRYKSEPIETLEYFKTVYRYILKNPEKANICDFNKYKWSSLQIEKDKSIINFNYLISIFGSEKNKNQFLGLINQDICMENISNQNLNEQNLYLLFIKQLFSIENILSINKEPNDIKKQRINILKKCGFSVNQIARFTGISKYFIKKA